MQPPVVHIIPYLSEGVKGLGYRPRRGRFADYLMFLVNGCRIRRLFDSRYILSHQSIPFWSQCRYRWKLCTSLGLIHIQRTARGQWFIEIRWERLYELACLGGYNGTYHQFTKALNIPTATPSIAYQPEPSEVDELTAAYLHLYPNHPHHAPYAQVRRAIRTILEHDGPEAAEELLTATQRLARQMKHQARRTDGQAGEGTRYVPSPVTYIYSRRWKHAHNTETMRIARAQTTPATEPTPPPPQPPPAQPPQPPPPHDAIRNALRNLYQTEPPDETVEWLTSQTYLAGMLLGAPTLFQRRFPTMPTP